MPALAPAVVLALATQWGTPIAPREILAQARVESGLDPLAIHDDVTGQVYHPPTLEDALRIATHCEMQGHDIDAGLMQVNSGNFPWLHLSLAEAFDPVQSIRAGVQVLTAISRYNTGSPTGGLENGYVERVASTERAAAPTSGASGPRSAAPAAQQTAPGVTRNDLINALIQPGGPSTAPAAAAGSSGEPHGAAGDDGAPSDPLIHPQASQPSAAPSPGPAREASNG